MEPITFVLIVVSLFALFAATFTGLVLWANWDIISAEFKKIEDN